MRRKKNRFYISRSVGIELNCSKCQGEISLYNQFRVLIYPRIRAEYVCIFIIFYYNLTRIRNDKRWNEFEINILEMKHRQNECHEHARLYLNVWNQSNRMKLIQT